EGRVQLLTLPALALRAKLSADLQVQCGVLSPLSNQLALGGSDGTMRFVAIEHFDHGPLFASATPGSRQTATKFHKMLGRSSVVHFYQCLCPVCQKSFELPGVLLAEPVTCPACRRRLRIKIS